MATAPKHYWNYFLSLEKDLIHLSRYIEFNQNNYSTYSIELVRLILAAGSEVDVILKLLSKEINPSSTPENITQYANIIFSSFPDFSKEEVFIPKYDLQFKPWDGWTSSNSPHWWKKYNEVKHQRNANFVNATLENALNAIAALLVAETFLYKMLSFPADNDSLVINRTRRSNELYSELLNLDDKYNPNEI